MFGTLWASINQAAFSPVKVVWRRDRGKVLIFAIPALLGTQLVMVSSFLFSVTPAVNSAAQLLNAWTTVLDRYLESGNCYVFAVTLLFTTCASFALDWLDHPNEARMRPLLETRLLLWLISGGVLVIFQMLLAGPLVSDSIRKTLAEQTAPASLSFLDFVQLVLWIGSMSFAVVFYCVTRLRHHPDILDELEKRTQSTIARAGSAQRTNEGEEL